MSRDLERQLREDRALRDAAYALVQTDLTNLKADWSEKGIASRSVERLKDGASGVYDEAVQAASDHRGVLAAILAALGLWLARHPLIAAFTSDSDSDRHHDDDEWHEARS